MNTSLHNKMLFVLHHWGTCYTRVLEQTQAPREPSRKLSLLTTTTPIQSQHAQCYLGQCYEHGRGVTQDYQEARRLYALASSQGLADATMHLKGLDQKIRTECPLLGQRVVITGTSREDLTGTAGVATSFDHARGRYVVELDSREGEKEKERLKPKPQSLHTKMARKQGKEG